MYSLYLMLFYVLLVEMFSERVEEVIQAGLVPRFVEFLTWDEFPQLQVSFDTPVIGALYVQFGFISSFTRWMCFRFMEQLL